jgi:hypothetical protein
MVNSGGASGSARYGPGGEHDRHDEHGPSCLRVPTARIRPGWLAEWLLLDLVERPAGDGRDLVDERVSGPVGGGEGFVSVTTDLPPADRPQWSVERYSFGSEIASRAATKPGVWMSRAGPMNAWGAMRLVPNSTNGA